LLRNEFIVKSYTLHPRILGKALAVNEHVQKLLLGVQGGCPEMMESIEVVPERLREIQIRWQLNLRNSVMSRDAKTMADWIASQAYVKREYTVDCIVLALKELGLLHSNADGALDCSAMTHESCASRIPPNLGLSNSPWKIMHNGTVSAERCICLPFHRVGLFIGKKGKKIKELQETLASQMHGPHWGHELLGSEACPSLQLKITGSCVLTLTFKWAVPWQRGTKEPKQVACTAEAVAKAALLHVQEVYLKDANECFNRREQRRERFQMIGQSYHSQRRSERERRRNRPLEAVQRALTLPRTSRCSSHPGGRKELLRHRRRVAQREKRQNLLRACDSLKPVLSTAKCLSEATRVTSEERWCYLIAKITETEHQRECRQLMESQHLSGLQHAIGELCNERVSGAAKRLQCQIKAVARVSGLPLLNYTAPLRRCKQKTQEQNQEKTSKQRKAVRKQHRNRRNAVLILGIDI
jgi:hypothetical protein